MAPVGAVVVTVATGPDRRDPSRDGGTPPEKGFPDIDTLLAEAARSRPDRVAIEDEAGVRIDYAGLHRLVRRIGAGLQALCPGPGGRRARFGIVMPNGSAIAVTLLGAAVAGEAAPFNPHSTESEFEAYFAAVGIDALIVRDDEDGPAVAAARRAGTRVVRLTRELRIDGPAPAGLATPPARDDVALVLMTSGSTGQPKIVPLTHRNVCCSAHEVATSLELTPDDLCLAMWEQFHIGGLVDLLLAPLTCGSRLFVTGGFDVETFFRLLGTVRPTWYQAVPTTLNELVVHAERHGGPVKPNALRFIRSVAAALSPAVMDRAVACFGVPVVRTFGMTEASPLITTTPLPPLPQKPGSVGKSCGTEIRIFGPDGSALPAGAEGEVGIRGENVFSGYRGDEAANRAAFRDGWFLTGDVGIIDAEGDLFLTGRIRQMINRGGEKISPQEVDDVLARHPAVVEAATFAVGHRTLGEDVAAAVVLREAVDVAALRAFARQSLAAFKVPQRIIVRDRLPRNPVGKIDRLALSKMAEAESLRGTVRPTPPGSDMERLLAALWARELFLPDVGVDQDFGLLGGDSLSMLRIQLGLEGALGRPVPPDILTEHATIRAIAARLDRDGFRVPEAEIGAEDRASRSLEAVTAGTEGFTDLAGEFRTGLRTCPDPTRLKAIENAATIYATPSELLDLLDAARWVYPGLTRRVSIAWRVRVRLCLASGRWRRSLRSELTGYPGAAAWRREALGPNALLYRDPAVPAGSKRLIVGFTGNFARLFLPTYRILGHLDPNAVDLLLLRDPAKALFVTGAPDLGPDLSAVARYADRFAAREGYRDVIAFGTSGGAPAAIFTGLVNRWSRAVAVGAPDLSIRPELPGLIAEAVGKAGPTPSPVVLVHGADARDEDAARDIRRRIAWATIEARTEFKRHNVLNEAYEAGQLASLFSDWFRPLTKTSAVGSPRGVTGRSAGRGSAGRT